MYNIKNTDTSIFNIYVKYIVKIYIKIYVNIEDEYSKYCTCERNYSQCCPIWVSRFTIEK